MSETNFNLADKASDLVNETAHEGTELVAGIVKGVVNTVAFAGGKALTIGGKVIKGVTGLAYDGIKTGTKTVISGAKEAGNSAKEAINEIKGDINITRKEKPGKLDKKTQLEIEIMQEEYDEQVKALQTKFLKKVQGLTSDDQPKRTQKAQPNVKSNKTTKANNNTKHQEEAV